jgi:hypothetical protein
MLFKNKLWPNSTTINISEPLKLYSWKEFQPANPISTIDSNEGGTP